MQPRPQMRQMGPPDHRGPPPLMLQKIERPHGLGGPRPDSPMNDDSEGSSLPPPEEKKPEEMKLPSALEKVLAFKDMRAQEVGLTPEELEQLDKPEGIYEPFGPRREKTCLRGFQQSEIQTSLLSYRD